MESVKEFLSFECGDGSSSGSGDGSGSGYGSGFGSGFGKGYGYGGDGRCGCGFRNGDGYGSGYREGIKAINGKEVYNIDNVQTLINHVHGNVAKGKILMDDLSLRDCYIVKQDGIFAHGDTLKKAWEALYDKLFDDMPEDDRIQAFVDAHKSDKEYPNEDFFDWHHKLTGSCEAGRKAFVQNHGIDMNGSMTVNEFIKLTENDFGGKIIRKLKSFF